MIERDYLVKYVFHNEAAEIDFSSIEAVDRFTAELETICVGYSVWKIQKRVEGR